MNQLAARYPFLSRAREAVEMADVDLADVVREGDPAVDRALERVQNAITNGVVGEPVRSHRTELLSYPVARVLVSLADEPILNSRYVRAEAATAFERFSTDLLEDTGPELQSVSQQTLGLADLLAEFDLSSDVRSLAATDSRGGRPTERFEIDVVSYLRFATDIQGEQWRLVNRTLDDGTLSITREELFELLEAAVRERVDGGLPLPVPEPIEASLGEPLSEIQETIAEFDLSREIDTVVPELFPPCMTHLIDRVRAGDHLEHHSRFAITAFLTTIGLTTDEIVDLYRVNSSFGEEMTRYQTDHIRGETSPTEYTPPSCATMQSYGDCVNMDDLCDSISHPLGYYEAKLSDAEDDDLEDWREREQTAAQSDGTAQTAGAGEDSS